MRINEIEKQLESQRSTMQAFPSQGPSIEQMYSGQNQRSAVEVQIATVRSVALLEKRLERLTEVVATLYNVIEQQQISSQKREKIEDTQNFENTRLSRIAAWAGVSSIVVSVILAAIGIWAQIALK